MNASEIKARLKAIEAEKQRLDESPKLLELELAVEQAQRAYQEELSRVRELSEARWKRLDDEASLLVKEREDLKNKKLLSLPEDVQEWFNEELRRFPKSSRPTIVWISPMYEWVIYKRPGRRFWSGIGNTAYSPAELGLVRVGNQVYYENVANLPSKPFKENLQKLINKIGELDPLYKTKDTK